MKQVSWVVSLVVGVLVACFSPNQAIASCVVGTGSAASCTDAALAAPVAPAQSGISFSRTNADSSVGWTPVAIVSTDFNADGKADLAVANNDSDDVSVLYGNGDGTFLASGASFQVGVAPSAIAVGDFNGDGKPDIVTANEIDNTVSVLLNQGTVFGAALTADTGSTPEGIAVGDFNGDGKLDVATADDFDDTVTILLGVGDGTFAPEHAIAVGAAPIGLVAVDLNGDGKLDLVVTNSSGGADATGTLTVLKGVGDGTFVTEPEIASSLFNFPTAIVSADFNGDGKPDLAVANQDGDTVTVLLGDGTGVTFQILTPSPPVAGLPYGIVAADFDGDGKVDIATSGNFADSVSVIAGVGDGTFQPKVDFSVGAAPTGLVANDFNGDGKLDIAVANEQGNTVSVLLNTSGTVPPPSVVATRTATATRTQTPTPTPSPTQAIACAVIPRTGCQPPQRAAAISLNAAARRVGWRWLGGSTPEDVSQFGDPVSGLTAFHLCVYDTSAGPPFLAVAATVPAGGTCGTQPCWKQTRDRFSYTNAAATPDGVRHMTLQASGGTGAYITVSGRGANLHMPVSADGIFLLREFPEVIVQVQRSNRPDCWESVFTSPAIHNTRGVFADTIH